MATYYVSTTGSDVAAGTSPGAAWATIAHAVGAVAVGDVIVVMADGTHSISSTLIVPTTCTIIGGNSSGVIDGTRPTINGTGNSLQVAVFQAGANGVRFIYLNVSAWQHKSAILAASFRGVVVHGCDIDGSFFATGGQAVVIDDYGCVISRSRVSQPSVTQAAIYAHNGGVAFECIVDSAADEAITLGSYALAINCVTGSATGRGIEVGFTSHAIGCVANGADDGLYLTSNYGGVIDSKAISCARYGFVGFGTGNTTVNCIAGAGATANTTGDFNGAADFLRSTTADAPIASETGAVATWDWAADSASGPEVNAAESFVVLNGDANRDIGAGDFAASGGGSAVILPRTRVSGG